MIPNKRSRCGGSVFIFILRDFKLRSGAVSSGFVSDLTVCKKPAIENALNIFIKSLTKFQQSGKVSMDYEILVICLLLITGAIPES